VVDADEYLKHLSRYIHLNPVRTRMIEHCKDYPWSSYPVFGGYEKAPEWLETDWLLSLFGQNRKKAMEGYRKFVESIQNEKIENPSKDIVSGIILGGTEFINWIKRNFLSEAPDNKEKPQLKSLKPGLTFEKLMPAICNEFACTREVILQKGKKGNLARDVAIYLSREMTGESGVDLGRYFGISGAGVTVRHGIIAEKIKKERKLNRQVSRIKKAIIKN
jgi:putative transposase